MIDEINLDTPEKTQDYKQRTLIQIAYRQAKNGDTDDAVKTAYESGFLNGIARILMKKAYLQAKNGENPSGALNRALTIAKQMKPDLWVKRNIAVAYSTAGRILAIAGKNPDEMFKEAEERIEKLQSQTDRSDSSKHLAMDMSASGKDSHRVLDAVLPQEPNPQSPFEVFSVISDVLDAAIECGYHEYFSFITFRLKNYIESDSVRKYSKECKTQMIAETANFTIELLTKRAKTFGENSLTREEIEKLSESEIQEIKKTKTPLALQALHFFKKA